MKIHLEKAIFVNRAPFDELVLDFSENEIAVLSAVNGRGKTTILSHIVDVFYEMARPHFPNEFEDNKNKFYRVSSPLYNLDRTRPSFVYLRFKTTEGTIDYIDIRNNCTEQQYNEAITIENKIPFGKIKSNLELC
jgi:predicted ATP-binding protein involved in virulence